MRFDTPKSLSSVLEDFLEKFPQKRKLKQGMILSAFEDVVGERMASEVEDLHFEGNKLAMTVRHPSWRHEIHTNRFSIAKKLNLKVKGDIISDIIVRG
ncbi:MAG TPA: DciA family protein [Gracilimonas sp.]|uniref:DciA family protein n=1 Tax=Gracilimonas sp. TaxID=1974203 RepID=UPI002DA612F2|nr:DciA family protein [Gracilimonas sp.]